MKKCWKQTAIVGIILMLGVVLCTSACSTGGTSVTEDEQGSKRIDSALDTATAIITLSDEKITVSGADGGTAEGVLAKENTIEITAEGTYEITGRLSNGQIYVEASDEDTVILLLNGVNVTNETEPAIYAENAKKLCIMLADGSDNLLQSGTSMPDTTDEDADKGTVFCRDDLVLSGTGVLTVNGYINDGIHGNDDLDIESGTVEINAAHHALKTNDTLTVKGGSLNLTSGEDGIHTKKEFVITGGDILITAGDDGIHAGTDLTMEGGTVEINDSYEGMEANRIHIKDGAVSVTSRDDGINAYGGQDSFAFDRQTEEKTAKTETEDLAETAVPEIRIDGGTIFVNADGDGLDSNYDLIIGGGTVIIDGPETNDNGALDYGKENGGICRINGGTVLAIGAYGMAERFGESSLQASFLLQCDTHSAGTKIKIEDSSENEIFTYISQKSFSSVVFSSPEIKMGEDYSVTVGDETISFTQNGIFYPNTTGGIFP